MAAFSFSGTIRPTRLSLGYRGGLLVVAIAMLLLPLVYLGVIVLAGAAVWWHLTHNVSWIQGAGAIQFRILGYAAPALAGIVVTFFMIKPVFARRERLRQPLVLAPHDHPVLFEFIKQICAHVRAPVPRFVQVDCAVNASASFAPQMLSMIRRNLVLTIGLPLVHALSIRELGGVLAHEFGHFAQGSGLSLTVVVRSINGWFSRVVYERDSWDRQLDASFEGTDVRIRALLLPSRAGVWLSRQILRRLMVGGHVISCYMMRQMEYDADSYEVKIAGSDTFARTMGRVRELTSAAAEASAYVQAEFAARRLPADLPLFLVMWHHTRPVSADGAQGQTRDRTTGLFDTHPADADRLAAAAQAADPGILLGGDESAARLFHDFDTLSRNATRHHYESSGILEEVRLVEAQASLQASVEREVRQQALFSIFEFGISKFRPLRVPASADRPHAAEKREPFPDALERFDDYVLQGARAFAVSEAVQSGYTGIEPTQFGVSEWTLEAAAAAEREAVEKLHVLSRIIEPYERTRLARVARGLERIGQSGEEDCSPSDLQVLVEALSATAACLEAGAELFRISHADVVLTHLAQALGSSHPARERHARLKALESDTLARIRQTLAGFPCPRFIGTSASTLEEACELPGLDDPSRAVVVVQALRSRLLLEACWLARRGEELEAAEPAVL